MREWPNLPAKRRDMFLKRSDVFLIEVKKDINNLIAQLESERKS